MEMIIRASKVSMKKNSKNLNRIENFVKRFKSFCFKLSTVLRNDSFRRTFFNFWGETQVWSD